MGMAVEFFAVVDVETTGFRNSDRVVELSVVVANAQTFEVVAELDTLINPLRDIGATEIHGITASMLEAAPTFAEVVAPVAALLNGAVLVAHNLPFDQRFLMNEFERCGISVDPGHGLCTLRLSGERLSSACSRFDIPLTNHHRALSDARATLGLLKALRDDEERLDRSPLMFQVMPYGGVPRTLRRDALGAEVLTPFGARFTFPYPASGDADLSYLAVLDDFLADLILTSEERDSLTELALSFGLDEQTRTRLHNDYMSALISAVKRDGVITDQEHHIMEAVATALAIDPAVIPEITATAQVEGDWLGKRICFTGSATVRGRPMEREKLEALAAAFGMQPVSSVSKKGCDVLIAADTSSLSGKAQKARGWGIPVVGVEEFMANFLGPA